VYRAGKTDHTIEGTAMIEHIVELVEAKATELQAAKEAEKLAAE
jgi:(E)-4-hydroxy-3-methylbut-2-enyl-diphosphate synthase